MSTWTDQPTAPVGVLIPPSSASTGTAVTGPPSESATTPPRPSPPRRTPSPLRPRDFGWKDAGVIIAAALSSLCAVWVFFFQLTDLSGAFGFLVCWYLLFLLLTWVATAQMVEPQAATDRVIGVVVVTGAAIIFGIVAFIVIWVAAKAIPHMHWGALFTKDASELNATNPSSITQSGVLHAIIGTLEQMAISAAIGVPIAIATAIYLNEVGHSAFTRLVRTVVTAMSGTPSIVAGVFIYSIFILPHTFGIGFSGIAASLALTVILLPSVTRVVEEVLRVVPSGLREASMALGAPQWRTVWSVVLPTARSGVVTGILLGVARIVGETAPLIYTEFGSQLINANPFSHPQESLPFFVYNNVRTAQPLFITIAFQAAFVLMVIVLVLFALARILGRTRGKKSSKLIPAQDDPLARMFVPVPLQTPSHEGGDSP